MTDTDTDPQHRNTVIYLIGRCLTYERVIRKLTTVGAHVYDRLEEDGLREELRDAIVAAEASLIRNEAAPEGGDG